MSKNSITSTSAGAGWKSGRETAVPDSKRQQDVIARTLNGPGSPLTR